MNRSIEIALSNVTKIYNIHERGSQSLRDCFAHFGDSIQSRFIKPDKKNIIQKGNDGSIIYALKNISFNVKKGEALGIIGANGSGKTTILRLLSNVSSPTFGKVMIEGSVAPLIQVGAGFHPELTGRENVYLNAIIMGLSKKQIDEKYDDIVAFAELELFMDTPIKMYSSGMYVRLGFAVIANIDPDILLIDEILSVGDIKFQKKCLDAISKFRKSGKSIVFVSHNLSTVRDLCDRVIWIDKGEIKKEGDCREVVDSYTSYMTSNLQYIHDDSYMGGKTRWGTGEAKFINVDTLNIMYQKVNNYSAGDKMIVRLEYEAYEKINSPEFAVALFNNDGIKIFGSFYNKNRIGEYFINGRGVLDCIIDTISLRPGSYCLAVGINVEIGSLSLDRIGRAAVFTIDSKRRKELENYDNYGASGIINMSHEWRAGE